MYYCFGGVFMPEKNKTKKKKFYYSHVCVSVCCVIHINFGLRIKIKYNIVFRRLEAQFKILKF